MNRIRQVGITLCVVVIAFIVRAGDLTVNSGETVDLPSGGTYGTVIVNGVLNLTGGKFYADHLYIGKGSGETGVMNVTGTGMINMGKQAFLHLGSEGGAGELNLNASGVDHVINYPQFESSADSTLRLYAGTVQGTQLQTTQTATGNHLIEFRGGYMKFTTQIFVPKAGVLTLASIDGNPIQFYMINDGSPVFNSTWASGRVRTTGSGALLFSIGGANSGILLNKAGGDYVSFEHTGGVELLGRSVAGVDCKKFKIGPGALLAGQKLLLKNGARLDLAGNNLSLAGFATDGTATSVADTSAAGTVTIGNADAQDVSEIPATCTWSVPFAKTGASTLKVEGAFTDARPISIEGGVLEVNGSVVASTIIQGNGGKIRLGENGVLTVTAAKWLAPAFTEDSAGRVVLDPGVEKTLTVLADDIRFSDDVQIKSGTVLLGKSGASSHRYFKLSIYGSYRDPACTQLGEFKLLDANGKRLNAGLKAVAAGTASSALEAGTCCYAAGYSQGGSSSVQYLFDNNTATKMCLTGLSWRSWEQPQDNDPRVVLFRLADTVTENVVAYQLTTANDACPDRNPVYWVLEGSDNGTDWQELARVKHNKEAEQTTTTLTDYVDGPFAIAGVAVGKMTSAVFAGNLQVDSGCTLDVRAVTRTVSSLKVDASAYAGGFAAISGFAPVENGRIYINNPGSLVNRTIPISISAFDGQEAALKSWKVYLDGILDSGCKVKASGTVLKLCDIGFMLLFR